MIVELTLFLLVILSSLLYYVNNKHLFSSQTEIPFLRKYLVLYVLAVSADWIQGPYMYDLYTTLGFSWQKITAFYLTSFLSSAVAGTFVGAFSDYVGHRISALAYCVFYAVSALLKISSNSFAQFCSSATGGVACTLLYTVFDSWLVSEHKRIKASPQALSRSFSLESALSSVTAIIAGIVGSILVDGNGGFGLGPRAPFIAAAIVLFPCAICVFCTMHPKPSVNSSDVAGGNGVCSLIRNAWSFLLRSERACLVCVTQALFESSMYVFVILWTLVLRGDCSSTEKYLSTLGWIFSAFMVAMTTGSQIYGFCTSKKMNPFTISSCSFIVASFSLFLPCLVQRFGLECKESETATYVVFFCFLVFEGVCGVYYPVINDFKAKYFPSEICTGLMSISRVGQNIIITTVLLVSNFTSNAFLLFVASMSLCLASFIHLYSTDDEKASLDVSAVNERLDDVKVGTD